MEPEYNAEEIETAAKKLKNNKAAGGDEVSAELIIYGCRELYQQVASLINATSEKGDYSEEIRRGILTPLAKLPKKNEQVNVRPIILLSVLRKIITITLIDRCWERMTNHIPLSQAAHQKGRSTTEQVFTIKIFAEIAIKSANYDIFLLFLDMSKDFNAVNRSKLMEIFKDILTPRELHMMYLLINDVILNVKIGDKVGADILTAIGTCQGDCLSALLFIIYLSYAIKPIPKDRYPEDYRQTLWSALDWIVDRDKLQIQIETKYADGVTFIRSEEAKINQGERVVPSMLCEEGLSISKSNSEKYHISKCSDTKWKSCKYLGSLIGNEEDIKRRKGLTNDNYHALESILKSKLVSESVGIRIFRAYIESIFHYTSELWISTNTLERSIDSFHQRLLRKVIHVTWPRVITNEELYKHCTKTEDFH